MARAMLVALLVELALYAAAGWRAWAQGVPPLLSAFVALAVFLALRLAVLAWLLVRSRRARAAQSAALGIIGGARLLLAELLALLDVYVWGLLMQRWRAPRDPARIERGALPVLFVHGVLCNAGVWHRCLAALERGGATNLFTVNLEPPLESIDRFAQQLARRAEEVCRAADAQRAIVVGHSMGGLVARTWIARHGGAARAARLVTIGSPHRGSRLALGFPARWATELLYASAWLEELDAREADMARVPTTSIYSWHDEFVAPQDSSRVEGARNVPLERLGHLELLRSPQVHALLAGEIAAARGGRPS